MDFEQLVTQLEATGDDRVPRRFATADLYAPFDGTWPGQPIRAWYTTGVMIFDWLRPTLLVWLACVAWFFGLGSVLLG